MLMEVEGSEGLKITNTLDLKNPYFRYTGQAPPPPPGHHSTAPTETMWTALGMDTSKHTLENGLSATLNGSLVDGMGNLVEMGSANPIMAMGQMTQMTQMSQMGVIPVKLHFFSSIIHYSLSLLFSLYCSKCQVRKV